MGIFLSFVAHVALLTMATMEILSFGGREAADRKRGNTSETEGEKPNTNLHEMSERVNGEHKRLIVAYTLR